MVDPQIMNFLNVLDNPSYSLLFLVLVAWGLVWKGIALWKSAQSNQKKWFIALLLINTFGILEMIYLFYFSRKKPSDITK